MNGVSPPFLAGTIVGNLRRRSGVAPSTSVAGLTYHISNAGDDGDDGLTPETAKQTLAAVAAIPPVSGDSILLNKGDIWRESLNLPSIDGVTLGAYGTGAAPIISGADVITAWTLTAAQTNTYESEITHDATGTNRLTVYEDGVLLTRVADIATVESTPGSFRDVKGSDGSPVTIHIHPSDSGNPTSNGKAYEVTTRNIGVLLGEDSSVSGIHTRRVMSNNGSFESSIGSNISRLLTQDGTKHNALVSSGLVEDSVAVRIDTTTSYELSNSYWVNFLNDAAGLIATYKRVGAVSDLGGTRRGIGHVMHDVAGNPFATFDAEQIWGVDLTSGWTPSALVVSIDGLYVNNISSPLDVFADTGSLRYLQIRQSNGQHSKFQRWTPAGAATITLSNCIFYDAVGGNDPFIRLSSAMNGLNLVLENCVIYSGGSKTFMAAVGGAWASGSLTINNCLFVYPLNGNPILVPAGITYTGDNNVYLGSAATNINFNYQGTVHDTLAAIRTATGQEANSISFGPADLAALFSGTVADGDFRLGGAGAGAAAAAINAGPQNHWDWNARAVAAGPPVAWPDVPDTLAEALTYIADPVAWDFYP